MQTIDALTVNKPGSKLRAKRFHALLELRKALLDENYELCARIIERARKFKARGIAINRLLSAPLMHLENMEF